MRVAIHTLGTRGDVQPYIALARGLVARGHAVQIAAPAQYEAMVVAHGLACVPLPGEFLALMDTPEGKAAIGGGAGFSAGFKLIGHVRPLMRRLFDAEWTAARDFGADLIVYHPKSIAAPHIAERLAIPEILASPLPGFTATAEFPSPILPFASLGPFNRMSHGLAIAGGAMLFRKEIRAFRESLGLPARAPRRPAPPTLYAYSPHVLPRPADWGPDVGVTGYWFLDGEDWTPDPALAAFLAAGDKPVYVGFGSMPGLDPVRLTATIVEAFVRTGRRGLLATGGGALADVSLPANIHLIAGAPHEKLFPLTAATIHHGGAGTTGASLRAGRPTAICPFFGDQPFWGRRIAELGLGPAPLDRKRLTPDALAAALAALADPAVIARAEAIGEKIRAEDGVGAAIAFIAARAG